MAYDYYGKLLATCSGDKIIKIFKLINNHWMEIQEIRYSEQPHGHSHQSAIRHICWAHPLFGSIFATVSMDKTVNIFELRLAANPKHDEQRLHRQEDTEQVFQYVRVSQFTESVDLISCEFSPHHLGLQLAIVCSDGIIKIMEARDLSKPWQWLLSHQIIIHQSAMPSLHRLPFQPVLSSRSNVKSMQNKTDTQLNRNTQIFCVSWNHSKWEIPTFCVGANHGTIFIYGCTTSSTARQSRQCCAVGQTWSCIQKIDLQMSHSEERQSKKRKRAAFDVYDVCWANHMARKHHLIAAGCSDGFVRIIKITRKTDSGLEQGKSGKSALFAWSVVFEGHKHTGSVWRVKWNLSGTALLSAGDDGNVYLWQKDRIQNAYTPKCLTSSDELLPTEQNRAHARKQADSQRGSMMDVEREEQAAKPQKPAFFSADHGDEVGDDGMYAFPSSASKQDSSLEHVGGFGDFGNQSDDKKQSQTGSAFFDHEDVAPDDGGDHQQERNDNVFAGGFGHDFVSGTKPEDEQNQGNQDNNNKIDIGSNATTGFAWNFADAGTANNAFAGGFGSNFGSAQNEANKDDGNTAWGGFSTGFGSQKDDKDKDSSVDAKSGGAGFNFGSWGNPSSNTNDDNNEPSQGW
eukprot:CAMPEP_0197074856 /NCGR_PEP_ID=MMETSP1384-20130603/211317_1 /TAXON_ID=29189 /ORGANISM="Ammonia sp." /LENGTH=627 /DNA_ID=CAMNT_0042513697 /DNA_START=102 /DNA_END=1982 /DNA_ORIENTATION=+